MASVRPAAVRSLPSAPEAGHKALHRAFEARHALPEITDRGFEALQSRVERAEAGVDVPDPATPTPTIVMMMPMMPRISTTVPPS